MGPIEIEDEIMSQKPLDALDELLINILGEKNPQTAQSVYEKVEKHIPNKPKTIVWTRLIKLVESGHLELVYSNEDPEITLFKIK